MMKSITAALKLSEIRESLNDLNAIAGPDRRAKNRGTRSARESEND